MNSVAGAIEQIGKLLNKLFGSYQKRVMKGLIGTGDNLVPLVHKPILEKLKNKKKLNKREKQIHHFCRQWKANRKKLK